MTNIIVKGADFSDGELYNYVPPVAGAKLVAFVGDQRDSTSLRNFGSGADLIVHSGNPLYQGNGFRRFGPFDGYRSDAFYTENMTILAVCRSVYPLGASKWGTLISSERDASDGGRRGAGMGRPPSNDYWRAMVNGTLNGASVTGTASTPIGGMSEANSAGFLAATFNTGAVANTVELAINRLSDPTKVGTGTSAANTTFAPAIDEASYPLLVGTHYRVTSNYDPIDIGFIAVYPRKLTTTEISTMYKSVQRRFASLGVSI